MIYQWYKKTVIKHCFVRALVKNDNIELTANSSNRATFHTKES